MYALKISATKVMGTCTAAVPLVPGDYFTVTDGDIRIPEGKHICIWALHSLLPLITTKEREIAEDHAEDWLWRVHHAQCPDPEGRVIFKIEQQGKIEEISTDTTPAGIPEEPWQELDTPLPGGLKDVRVVVNEVRGKCTSGMQPGDYFSVHGGLIGIPPGRHFCLYALQAVLPFIAARQRTLQDGDWLKDVDDFICPDPAGNVIMRIETFPH
jgi:uncharacterized repeat protein (TIGR04076 family)